MSKLFTIVYKTYKNDLCWLRYSLLSLKKNLNTTNIQEIIIYTHDEALHETDELLTNVKLGEFIEYRIIPVHYDYHGYIKQQIIKCNCYKDSKTDYIIIFV